MDAWAVAGEMAEAQKAEAGVFQKWEADGDSHVMVLCGEPYARKMHWTGTLYEDCAGKDCGHCATGNRTILRVSLNAYHLDEQRMKIIEGGTRWFGDVQKVRKKYGLDTWAFEITRNGSPRDPKTTYSILPDRMLDEPVRQRVLGAQLHDLERDATSSAHKAFSNIEKAPSGAVNVDSRPANDDRDVEVRATVSHEVAKELHGLLKLFTKTQVREFMSVFDIKGISQLKASDENNARRFIAALDDEPPF